MNQNKKESTASENTGISNRHMKRQLVITFGGALILLLSGEAAGGGRNAILGIVLGYGVLLAYLWILVKNRKEIQDLVVSGNILKWLMRLFYGSFLVLTGSFLLEKTSQITKIYLSANMNQNLVRILILTAAVIGMGSDTRKRARMGEMAFSLIFWGFVLLLILSAVHMRVPDGTQMPPLDARSVFFYGYQYFCVGSITSLYPFAYTKIKGDPNQTWSIGKAWMILSILFGATVLILLGTYGYPGVKSMELPVLNLMAGTNLPGGFLDRFDIIWMALLLFSLLFSIGSLMFYCVKIFLPENCGLDSEKREGYTRGILVAATLIIWVLSIVNFRGMVIEDVYMRLLKFFYGPLFVIITLLAGFRKKGDQ